MMRMDSELKAIIFSGYFEDRASVKINRISKIKRI